MEGGLGQVGDESDEHWIYGNHEVSHHKSIRRISEMDPRWWIAEEVVALESLSGE